MQLQYNVYITTSNGIPPSESKRDNILIHAVEYNYVTNFKCVLNKKISKYELRWVTNDKTDWNNDPLCY